MTDGKLGILPYLHSHRIFVILPLIKSHEVCYCYGIKHLVYKATSRVSDREPHYGSVASPSSTLDRTTALTNHDQAPMAIYHGTIIRMMSPIFVLHLL